MKRRYAAFSVWSAAQSRRAVAGSRVAFSRAAAAPWKTIGLWTGGAFGVLVTALVLFLTFADWNALRGPIGRMASNMTGRQIVIAGDLDVRPWSLTPEVRVSGLSIGNNARFRERERFADIEHMRAAVRLFPLFIGRIDLARLELQGADVDIYRDEEGVGSWSSGSTSGKPFNLPAIREFTVRDGRIAYEDDKRDMTLEAEFSSQERLGEESSSFTLSGEGSINNQPFDLEFIGPALVNVRRDRPYAFNANIRAGATRIALDGSLRRPFDLGRFTANVEAQGADLADLYYLLGLALPNTPPYDMKGVIERNGTVYSMTDLRGRVGDSDLAGQFTVSRSADDRPFFEGDFQSASLDWDDLMTVFGGAPSTDAGETASAEQRQIAERLEAQGRVLPDATLDISRVRNMDARVHFRAARVRAPNIPLRALDVNIALDRGLLRADPIDLGLAQGRVRGFAEVNAREETPRVEVDARLTDARIETFIPVENAINGALAARVHLVGHGAAVREAASNANGNVTLVIPSGEVREAFAELTGINVTRGLGLLLSGDQSEIGIRCGVANFRARNGVMTAENIVIDTETMLITGGGQVNLGDETMDLRIEGEPKEVRLVRLGAPITLSGRWRQPDIGVEAGELIEEGGLAAALGALIAPLAAILPFVDAGLAEDANCNALFAEARSGGARASR